jgi:hypothetical protein
MRHFCLPGLLILSAAAFSTPFWVVARAAAQDNATTAPATTSPTSDAGPTSAPSGESLKAKVADVRGLVRVRNTPLEPWQKAAVGMELPEGAEVQTGPKSVCVCTIENDQTIVLDRLGVVSIAQAVKSGNNVKTDLVMKYGRTEYEIESAGAKHDSTIRSPSSTLAVRGTRVNLYDQPPFTPSAESYTGRAIYTYAKRQTALGGPGRGAIVRSDRGSAAESALGETVVDPSIAQARTNSDAKLIETEVSRGAIAGFDERTGIEVIKGGPGAPGDDELAKFLPGKFNVIARWTGNQDLNLVLDPEFFPANQILANIGFFGDNGPDEILFPGFGQNVTATGGTIAFDHRGGTNGGYEVAFYDKPKTGIYGIIVLPGGHGGREPADVKIQAFLDGKAIDMVFPVLDEQGNLVFDQDGFVQLEISKLVERVVTTNEQNVAGFTFVPSLDDLLGPPTDGGDTTGGDDGSQASNKPADKKAQRRAALQAERAVKQADKERAVRERLADREQRRADREAAKAAASLPKLGSGSSGPIMGPFGMPKK